MSLIITPTPGRIVHYYPADNENLSRVGSDPLAAIVCGVVDDRAVHLSVFDAGGNQQARRNVRLQQPGDEVPSGSFACWMPYQISTAGIGQAGAPTSSDGAPTTPFPVITPIEAAQPNAATVGHTHAIDFATSGYAVVVDAPSTSVDTASSSDTSSSAE